MTLNLTYLEELLSLGCFIDGEEILFNIPILALSEQVKPFQFKHKILPNESLRNFLYRIYDGEMQYNMDCSLFAQLASLILSNQWPTNGGNIMLFIAKDEEAGSLLWETKIPQMGYISCSDFEVAQTLSKLPVISKGQWVIQIEKNKFLGLAEELGPVIMTMEEWVKRIRHKLYTFSMLENLPFVLSGQDVSLFANKGLVRIFFKEERMNQWGYYDNNNFIACIQATWTKKGVNLKYNNNWEYFQESLKYHLVRNENDPIPRTIREIQDNMEISFIYSRHLHAIDVKVRLLSLDIEVISNNQHSLITTKQSKYQYNKKQQQTKRREFTKQQCKRRQRPNKLIMNSGR